MGNNRILRESLAKQIVAQTGDTGFGTPPLKLHWTAIRVENSRHGN
jgi:hypothetical protein